MSSSPTHNALILGGTHGIGLATAQLLLSGGTNVLVTGRSAETHASAREALLPYSDSTNTMNKSDHGAENEEDYTMPRATLHNTDITSLASLAALSARTTSLFGPGPCLDLLFINAGYAALEPFDKVTEESFARTISTNVFGAFFAAQAMAPLVRSGGSIVFTSSVATRKGIPGMSVYAGSKAFVSSLTQTLAAELAPRNIRVNSVSPGFVRTPTMGMADASKEALDEFAALGEKTTPLGRIAEAEEVAKVVVFLGTEATFCTGSEIVVDGGLIGCEKVEGH